jgi:hypothetical protein
LRELHESLIREQKGEACSDWGHDSNGSKKGGYEHFLKSVIKQKKSGKAQSDMASRCRE